MSNKRQLQIKVSYYYPRKAVLEVTENGNVIEKDERDVKNDADKVVEELQLKMLHRAGDYMNEGCDVKINPFTN